MNPSHRRRQGRKMFIPGEDPEQICPYNKTDWTYQFHFEDFLQGWKEAEKEFDENCRAHQLEDQFKDNLCECDPEVGYICERCALSRILKENEILRVDHEIMRKAINDLAEDELKSCHERPHWSYYVNQAKEIIANLKFK